MEEMGGGEGNNPKADNQRTDGEDPATRRTVVGSQSGRFASAENLAADTDGHEESAEDEGGPSHGLTFVPY